VASFLAFLGVSLIVIVTPGPDTAVTIRNAVVGGRAAGAATALGIAVGQLIWALAASAGIVSLLAASAPLFVAVKYAGAAYLAFLGASALLDALRSSGPAREASGPEFGQGLAPASAFRQGLISNLGNPKMAVFFASLLPQFAPAGGAAFLGLMSLGCVFAAMTFLWLALYVAALARAGLYLRRPAIRRAIQGVAGALLIGLGARLATERG
jgi:threonine/homoserine/homoserine lactone efflux protein